MKVPEIVLIAGILLAVSCSPTFAVCTVTNTFHNGNTADPSQVNQNFTDLTSCAAPTSNPTFTGAVGINTASPVAILDVHGVTFADAIHVSIPNSAIPFGLMMNNLTFGSTDATGTGLVQRNGGTFSIFNNNISAFSIDTGGNVGIGTTTPAQALEVNGQVRVDALASASSTSLCITATSNGVLATCSSSIRYKENVEDAQFGLKEIMAMRPVTFKWKGRDEQDFGLIAEEVAKIDPRYVTYKAGKIEGVKYPQLTAVLAKAVQEQQDEIKELKRVLKEQKSEITQLETKGTALQHGAVIQTAVK